MELKIPCSFCSSEISEEHRKQKWRNRQRSKWRKPNEDTMDRAEDACTGQLNAGRTQLGAAWRQWDKLWEHQDRRLEAWQTCTSNSQRINEQGQDGRRDASDEEGMMEKSQSAGFSALGRDPDAWAAIRKPTQLNNISLWASSNGEATDVVLFNAWRVLSLSSISAESQQSDSVLTMERSHRLHL